MPDEGMGFRDCIPGVSLNWGGSWGKKGGGGEDLKKKFVRPNLIFGCGEGRGRRVLSPWAYYTAAQSLQCLIRVCFSTNCFHFEVPDETCLKDMQLYMWTSSLRNAQVIYLNFLRVWESVNIMVHDPASEAKTQASLQNSDESCAMDRDPGLGPLAGDVKVNTFYIVERTDECVSIRFWNGSNVK